MSFAYNKITQVINILISHSHHVYFNQPTSGLFFAAFYLVIDIMYYIRQPTFFMFRTLYLLNDLPCLMEKCLHRHDRS
jgi:hypothetical protein